VYVTAEQFGLHPGAALPLAMPGKQVSLQTQDWYWPDITKYVDTLYSFLDSAS